MAEKYSWKLEREEELRLQIISGDAEIFGYELVPGQVYRIPFKSTISIVSWNGCSLEVTGNFDFAYTSKESLCLVHLNLHSCLQRSREMAKTSNSIGPRVLICGGTDVGKSTLCNLLLNYSARSDYPVFFVDLDVGQNEILPPGSVGAVLIDQPFCSYSEKSNYSPLAYFYGHTNLDKQPQLYRSYLKLLAENVRKKLEKSSKVRSSGLIINTCGYVLKTGLELLKSAIKEFEVVIDNELLFSQLKEFFSDTRIIAMLPKSGGTISLSTDIRRNLRKKRIRSYFYGLNDNLHPSTITISCDEINIYQLVPSVSEYFIPAGTHAEEHQLSVVRLTPSIDMQNHFCAISSATESSDILSANILGYVLIVKVTLEEDNRKLELLCPADPPLPNNNLIFGDIEYLDFS